VKKENGSFFSFQISPSSGLSSLIPRKDGAKRPFSKGLKERPDHHSLPFSFGFLSICFASVGGGRDDSPLAGEPLGTPFSPIVFG